MKALTVLQPWASLIAIGAKRYETRGWSPSRQLQVGDLLAIHAGKSFCLEYLDLCFLPKFAEALQAGGIENPRDLPLGAVIAVCRFGGAFRCSSLVQEVPHGSPEYVFGDHGPGRYAWRLDDVCKLAPVPAVGHQGLWEWEPERYLKGWLAEHGYA